MIRPTARKFGAYGGGRDDGEALQRFLDGIAGDSGQIDRDYSTGIPLRVSPGTTIYGPGTISAHASFSPADVMVNVPSGCRFYDVGFSGNAVVREEWGATMVYVSNASDVVFHGCKFSWWRTLVAMAATNRVQFSDCEFSEWGDSVALPALNTPEGEAALREGKPFQGSCMFDGGYALLGGNSEWPNDNVSVSGCRFHDGNWTAIECLQPLDVRWTITDTIIERVNECGIYSGVRALIDNVTIKDIKLRDCSAHSIEAGGIGLIIRNSRLMHPDAAGLWLTNPIDTEVVGNAFDDCMEIVPPDSDPTSWSSALCVRNVPAPPETRSNGLRVDDNHFISTKGKPTHCCTFFDQGGGPFNNCTIGPNRASGQFKGAHVMCPMEARGQNFHIIGGH